MKQPTEEDYLYDDLSRLIWATRNEPGLSINKIAKIFGEEFSEMELEFLIDALKEEMFKKVVNRLKNI